MTPAVTPRRLSTPALRPVADAVAGILRGNGARALLLSVGLGLGAPAMAATFNVTNTNDAGAGSLRQAIIDANGAAGADTINLSAVSGTITLTTGEIAVYNDSVAINGPGSATLTVSGGDNSRIFYIDNVPSVEINDLTISNGYSISGGGAIYSLADSLTIQDSVVTGSVADADGGGVYQGTDNSTLTIRNCRITDNVAHDAGGGVDHWGNYATLVIEDSTLSGNWAYSGGGAVYAADYNASVTLTRTTVSDNTASTGYGGGVGMWGGEAGGPISLTVTDSTLTGNWAYYNGGAIQFAGGDYSTLSIAGSTISGNTAYWGNGGGVYASPDYYSAMTVSDTTLSNNFANYDGGALAFYPGDNSTITITDSEISGNTARDQGGGIYFDADYVDIQITNSSVTGNSADYDGGGILIQSYSGTVTIDSSTISGNTANYGGGILAYGEYTQVNILNSTISGNTADYNGGGLVVYHSHVYADISHSTITGNHAGVYGGGLYVYFSYRVAITNSIVAGNTAGTYGQDIFNNGGTVDLAYTLVGDSATNDPFNDLGGNVLDQPPLLGVLQDNGGPTFTHLPAVGSLAIDAGDPAFTGPPTVDQRGTGYARIVNGTVDMGAVEVQAAALPTVALSLSGSPFSENGGSATVTATLSDTTTSDVTVTLSFGGTATNPDDYTRGATITIPKGQLTGTMTLTGVDDPDVEGDETIVVDIASVENALEDGTQQVTATITSDDVTPALPTVTLGLTGSPFPENGGSATVTATLSDTSLSNVTVTLSFGGSATNPDDYTRSGTITILAGNLTGTMTLTGVDDPDVEGDETIVVDIASVENALEDGIQQVTATITSDDLSPTPPTVTLGLSGSPMAEAGGMATVTANLSAAYALPVTVDLAFSVGTAVKDTDYTASATQIVIPAGARATSGSITLTAIQDALVEGSESFTVSISGVTNGTAGTPSQVTPSIADDDVAQPTVTLGPVGSCTEGGTMTITAYLSGTYAANVTVDLGFSGSAMLGTDYTLSGDPIVIPPGSTSGSAVVTCVNDGLVEGDETIVIDIDGVANGAEVGTQQQTGTVIDAAPAGSSAPRPVPVFGLIGQTLATLLLGLLGGLGLRRRRGA